MAIGAANRVEEIAQDLLEVATQVCVSTARGRRRHGDLRELEYLALATLQSQQPMIVGDIQRLLGVLPAQMSRIIRALEAREPALISCQINSQDKRKIDVCLTPAGEKALWDYREARLGPIVTRLRALSEDEQDELTRLVHKLNVLLDGPSEE
jgi:DNA-binding MarR family transcriptional regulator